MSSPTFEVFSISHAAVLDGSTGAEEADVYGVDDGSLDVDTGSFENVGDDTVLSRWEWLNFATLAIRGGYLPFETLYAIYGEPIASSGADPGDYFSQEFWTDRSMNVSSKPMLLQCPGKDRFGAARTIWIVLYKCSFGPISFDGPSYREGLKVTYNATALLSDVDEKGQDLGGYRSVGRQISAPSGAVWPPPTGI